MILISHPSFPRLHSSYFLPALISRKEELGLPNASLSLRHHIFLTLFLLIMCILPLSVYPTLANLYFYSIIPSFALSINAFCCFYLTLMRSLPLLKVALHHKACSLQRRLSAQELKPEANSASQFMNWWHKQDLQNGFEGEIHVILIWGDGNMLLLLLLRLLLCTKQHKKPVVLQLQRLE